jgi:hypothetical protein
MAVDNGLLPQAMLRPIASGELAVAAAAAWNAMNVEARSLGLELLPHGPAASYRTLAQQQALYGLYLAGRGNLAAVPGFSNHGWGLAVDVATPEMRAMIDRIGARFGWQKEWSDAPSEWWHIKYREGIYDGPDPGPHGESPVQPELIDLEENMITAVVKQNGAIEVFVEDKNGQVWHTWQNGPNTSWWGAVQGKKNASWQSLGTPGK